jgi:hypothetical protein
MDFLAEVGGVTELLLIIFSIINMPISKHSFFLKATKKLFLAETK